MVIRVNARRLAAGLVVLSLAGCGAQDEERRPTQAIEEASADGSRETAGSDAAEDCLLAIWETREGAEDYGGESERAFDRDHDSAAGGAISCATSTSASQFEKTLEALRSGATNGDRAQLLAEAGIPLLFIDKEGKATQIEDVKSLESAFDQVFTTETIDKLRAIALEDMTVVPEKGGFFDLGAIWLVVPEKGGRPQLVTVNDQAAAEAAVARAREEAEAAGQGGSE